MNIGTTIKNARKKLNMTQEQLAEYLNVSISAVSQWESDKTSPDITIIPSICNLLNVSADDLLGVNILRKQDRIDNIEKEAEEYMVIGKTEEAIKILREGLLEFPNSYQLMAALQDALYRHALAKEKLHELSDEIVTLGEKVLAECTNDIYRHHVIQILCYVYPEEKAVKLAETMPNIYLTCHTLLARVYKHGDRCFNTRKNLVISLISNAITELTRINTRLDDGNYAYTIDEEISLCNKSIALLDIFFENGDYGEYIVKVIDVNYQLTRLYCKKGDIENSL